MLYLIPAAAIIIAAAMLLPMLRSGAAHETVRVRRRVLTNSGFFLVAALAVVFLGVSASAAPAETVASAAQAAASGDIGKGLGYLAAALATGLSCLGAGIAIASTAPAAIGAFSEDPKAFGKALIFVVLGEGVALYGLLISILLMNKL